MPRPTDWSPLGLTLDPTPGDPERLKKLADYFQEMRRLTQEMKSGLDVAMGTAQTGNFAGKTADALRDHLNNKIGPFLQGLVDSSDATFQALTTFHASMPTWQRQADGALAEAQALGARPTDAATPEGLTAQTDYDEKIKGLRDQAVRAGDQQKAAGQTAADRVRNGMSNLVEVTDFWDELFKVLEMVALIITLPALILGGPLGLLAFALNAAIFVKTAVDFANGKAGVVQLLFAGLGLLGPTTKPLVGAATAGKLFTSIGNFVVDAFTAGKGALAFTKSGAIAFAKTLANAPIPTLLNLGKNSFNFAVNVVAKGGLFVVAGFKAIPAVLKGGGVVIVSAFKAVPGLVKYNFGGWQFLGTVLPVAAKDVQRYGLAGALKLGFLERGLGIGVGGVKAASLTKLDAFANIGKIVGVAGNVAIAPVLGKNAPHLIGPASAIDMGRFAPGGKAGDFAGMKPVNLDHFAPNGGNGLALPKNTILGDGTVFTSGPKGIHTPDTGTQFGGKNFAPNGNGLQVPVPGVKDNTLLPPTNAGTTQLPLNTGTAHTLTPGGTGNLGTVPVGSGGIGGPRGIANGVPGPMSLPDPLSLGLGRTGIDFVENMAANRGAAIHLETVTGLAMNVARGLDRMDFAPLRQAINAANAQPTTALLPPGGPLTQAPLTQAPPPAATPLGGPLGGVLDQGTPPAPRGTTGLTGTGAPPFGGVPGMPPVGPATGSALPPLGLGHTNGNTFGSDVFDLLGLGAPRIQFDIPVGGPNTPGAQAEVWSKALDDLAGGGPASKGKGPAGAAPTRIEAWDTYHQANLELTHAQNVLDDLRFRYDDGLVGTSDGAYAAKLDAAATDVANAQAKLADARKTLDAWGVDPAAAYAMHSQFMTEWIRRHPAIYAAGLVPGNTSYAPAILTEVPQGGKRVIGKDGSWQTFDINNNVVSETKILPDGKVKFVTHDPNSAVAWQLWDTADVATHKVTHTAFNTTGGDFRVLTPDGPHMFEVWRGGPDTPGSHQVLEYGDRFGTDQFTITPGAVDGKTLGGHSFELWDNDGKVLVTGDKLPGGGFSVTDTRVTDPGYLWEHWDTANISTHNVVAKATSDGAGAKVEYPNAGDAKGAVKWERWDTRDLTGHKVLESVASRGDGTYTYTDARPGATKVWEQWSTPNADHHNLLSEAKTLGPNGVQVTYHGGGATAFEVWDNAAVDAHTVRKVGTALGDGTYKVAPPHPLTAAGRDFQIWGNADAAKPTIVKDAIRQADDTYLVYNGAPGGGQRTWELWDHGNVTTHQVLESVTDNLNRTFRFTDNRPNAATPWAVWDSPARGTHNVLEDAVLQVDNTFKISNHRPNAATPWQIWDSADPMAHNVVKSADRVPGTPPTYRVTDNTANAGTPWQVWDTPSPTHHVVLKEVKTIANGPHAGAFQYIDNTPGRAFDWQLWDTANPATRNVMAEGKLLKNGTWYITDPRPNAAHAFELWNTADPASVTKQAIRLGDNDFKVLDTTAGNPNAWERWAGGDPGKPSLLDKVLRNDMPTPSVLERSAPNGTGGHTVVDLTGKGIPNRTYDGHGNLVEIGLKNGDIRTINHTDNTWQDVRPGGGGGANTPLPGRMHNGEVKLGPNGTYKLVDGNGTPVFTREQIPQVGGGHTVKDAYRDHTGKWVWNETDVATGVTLRNGERFVDWAENYRDITKGKFGPSRHVLGDTAFQYRNLADKGLLRVEHQLDGTWTWTRFDAQGNEILNGVREFKPGKGMSWQDVVTHVQGNPVNVTGGQKIIAQEQFKPVRGAMPGDDKFFSSIDKNRNFREYKWDPNGANDTAKLSDYHERNYVFEEVAIKQTLANGNELKIRRIHQQRVDSSWAGAPDFAGKDDTLFRHWRWTEKDALGNTIAKGIRYTRTDGSWQDFTTAGVLVRENRALNNGHKLEFGLDQAYPTRWFEKDANGGIVHQGDRVFGGNPQAVPAPSTTKANPWHDVANGAHGPVIHRGTVGPNGNVREYGTPIPANADPATGTWIDKTRFGQVVSRRDDIGGGQFLFGEGKAGSKKWTWTVQNADGTVVTVPNPNRPAVLPPGTPQNAYPPVPLTGERVGNRGGGDVLWNRPFDDGFRDFDANGTLLRELDHLDGGRTVLATRDANTGRYDWQVKGPDGTNQAIPNGWTPERVPRGDGWADVLVDPTGVRHTVREFQPGHFSMVREYHHAFDNAGNLTHDAAKWKDIRNGDAYRTHDPVLDPTTNNVTGYFEKDLKYLQWREYDVNHNLISMQSSSTKVWELGAPGGGWNVEKSFLGGHEVPDGFEQIGRLVDNKGLFNEFRGQIRMLKDTNRMQWGPPPVPGTTQTASGLLTFENKAWVKAGIEGFQGFLAEMVGNTIATLIINDGEFSWKDFGKVVLNATVSGTIGTFASRFHEARLGGLDISPKRFKDGLVANDFGKPFHTNPYFGDNWRTDFSHFDTPLRWRSGMYQFGFNTFFLSPLTTFVNNTINAAVFGDGKGNYFYGADALLKGAQAMAGNLAAGVTTGLAKFAFDAYAAGRYWRKSGILDISIKITESVLTQVFNGLLFNPWFKERAGFNPPPRPPVPTIPPPSQ